MHFDGDAEWNLGLRLRRRNFHSRGNAFALQQSRNFPSEQRFGQPRGNHHSCGDPMLLTYETEEQMLSADVAVAELVRSRNRLIEHYACARRIRKIGSEAATGGTSVRDLRLDRALKIDRSSAEVLQNVQNQGIVFREQPEEQMLSSDVVVMPVLSLFPRLDQRTANSGGKIVSSQVFLPLSDDECKFPPSELNKFAASSKVRPFNSVFPSGRLPHFTRAFSRCAVVPSRTPR